MRRNWNIVSDQSNTNYDVRNDFIYNTEALKSNICDYSDAYILVRGDVSIIVHVATQGAFKNCAPFKKYITKLYGSPIDDAEDLVLWFGFADV